MQRLDLFLVFHAVRRLSAGPRTKTRWSLGGDKVDGRRLSQGGPSNSAYLPHSAIKLRTVNFIYFNVSAYL